MKIDVKIIDKTIIVKVIGELDHHTSEQIRQEIDYYLMMKKVKNLIFDVSELTFIDSSGIGMFMGRYKKIKEKKGRTAICNISESNRRLLQMSGLFNIYEQFDGLEEALISKEGVKYE